MGHNRIYNQRMAILAVSGATPAQVEAIVVGRMMMMMLMMMLLLLVRLLLVLVS